ncbi:hypothetical protein [Akkermansia muciniphila]|uniref:hypothetical protein n=1 Tax=Akkermansia muciniphila TaxID=239935 RepID=UPI00196959BF|nr:hypothetical protein [Akkermansia muciniphila]
MSEKEVARHKEEYREVRESGEVSEFAVIAWKERVRELESELVEERRKVRDFEYWRLTVNEDLEYVASLANCAGTVGELFLSVMLLLVGVAGVVWGDVIICVCGFMLAWLACFLECRRLIKKMNEVWYKLDLMIKGERVRPDR